MLKAHGIVGNNVKTLNKSASKLWSDYSEIFPNGVKNQAIVPASEAARKACASVNIRVLGNAIVFPSGSGQSVRVRETKLGVYVGFKHKNSVQFDEVILSKDGNHLKYGAKIARDMTRRQSGDADLHAVWGTLKTHAYSVQSVRKSKGGAGNVHVEKPHEMVNGFMRDLAVTHEDFNDALSDDRYSALKFLEKSPTMNSDYVKYLQETNGTAALIRVYLY